MRKGFILVQIIALFFLFGCSSISRHESYISKKMNITMPVSENVEYTDEHGGFHGDGEIFAKIEFDEENGEDFIPQIENDEWNKTPLTKNLGLIMYGGERDDVSYGYLLAEKWGIPKVENGYWYFYDRHSKSSDPLSDKELLDRASFNFTLAIYDMDTNTLYYYEYDT